MVYHFYKKILAKVTNQTKASRRRLEVIFFCLMIIVCSTYWYLGLTLELDAETPRKFVETNLDENLEKSAEVEKGMGRKSPLKFNSKGFHRFVDTTSKRNLEKPRKNIEVENGKGCRIPNLDMFAKDDNGDKEIPKIICSGKDWVKCYHSKCRVVPDIIQTVHNISCSFEDMIYHSGQKYSLGPKKLLKGNDTYKLIISDHVKVACHGFNKTNGVKTQWSGNTLGFRTLVPKKSPPGREDSFNIVIFGFESAARNGFIRRMPKSWKVITEELGATVLEGYNILGDGTLAALLPILTGRTETELPDVRKETGNFETLDSFPFLFYKLRDDGYRTAYFEDVPKLGTFQYGSNGWRRQPTDHYLRSFLMEESGEGGWWGKLMGIHKKEYYCVGDTPQYKLMINITEQFLELDGKKFIFTFIADITHDDFNMITSADEDTAAFLRSFKKYSDDTMLVVMGDHGPRFSDNRNTLQGKLEERLPLMAILLPKKLEHKRPGVTAALQQNAHVLTTAHDLHATLLDVVGMQQHFNLYKVKGTELTRGLSLLKPIPRDRSCSVAGIEAHWCICLVWQNVSNNHPMYNKVANALLDYINQLLKEVESDCVPRTLTSVEWVTRQKPNSGLLSYSNSGVFGAESEVTEQYYQVTIVVGPGKGVYEASVLHLTKQDKIVIHTRDISRTNAYNDEPDCISATHPHLKPFCYCRKQISLPPY